MRARRRAPAALPAWLLGRMHGSVLQPCAWALGSSSLANSRCRGAPPTCCPARCCCAALCRPSVVNIANIALARNYYSTDVLKIPQGQGSGFVWDTQ